MFAIVRRRCRQHHGWRSELTAVGLVGIDDGGSTSFHPRSSTGRRKRCMSTQSSRRTPIGTQPCRNVVCSTFGSGHLLVFYAGLQAWPADGSPEALYIVGYFVVSLVGLAASFTPAQLNEFSKNAHVREALTDQAAAFIFAPGRGEASAESNCRYLAKVRPLAGTRLS